MNFELSYASPGDPLWRRYLMRSIETATGRTALLPIYDKWRREVAGRHPRMMQEAMRMTRIGLNIKAAPEWKSIPASTPLMLIANHPFGIPDGLALLSIAEELGRPYRVMLNVALLRVPEISRISLPIDFSNSREALRTNLASRAEARRLLREGVTIAMFPAGGVATAERLGGAAEDLPWKHFAAGLVEHARASVLPVHFCGQNGALFHFVSRYSEALRLSLLVAEANRRVGSEIEARIGPLVPYEELAHIKGRQALTDELYIHVHRLAPGAAGMPREKLLPPPVTRRRWFWDTPPKSRRSQHGVETGALGEIGS
ncbi:MAG: 1-acyl-sn-glycerol-3-phosphate acyltransferase [Proteobacteria bacterium]|nr:1-acyl-sn-glycerol-3-phosphate acyltransferase [Pseudomonadota bacterium]